MGGRQALGDVDAPLMASGRLVLALSWGLPHADGSRS